MPAIYAKNQQTLKENSGDNFAANNSLVINSGGNSPSIITS